ncbi:MAG: LPS export ABC transporter periplasmic protein LptC [Kiritimatiellae bacterium]|nr:LPS export ABC transporter periplasmic protein LptC [Kiritimatiellia bacterium]
MLLKSCRIWAVLLLLTTVVLAQDAELPIKGMRIPLEHFADGSVKMQFSAAQARAPEGGGEIKATEALVESFDVDGNLTMSMTAQTCRYDRVSGRIHSKSAVRMDRADMEVTGVGMDWKASEQRLRLHSNVRVVLKGRGIGKVLPDRRSSSRPDPREPEREGAE